MHWLQLVSTLLPFFGLLPLCSAATISALQDENAFLPHACPNSLSDAEVAKMEAAFLSASKGRKILPIGQQTYTVWFHNVVSGTEGRVSDERFLQQFDQLNKDFAPSNIHFIPGGITETTNNEWYQFADPNHNKIQLDMKRYVRKNLKCGDRACGAKDLIVHTVSFNDFNSQISGTLLGYATFPTDYLFNSVDDGVVLNHLAVSGGPFPGYSIGRTLTHEVGHWLGLFHTFQGGCAETSGGDRVVDTPAESDVVSPSLFECKARDTCPNKPGMDPIQNYMSYTDDKCKNQFSQGQIHRMQAMGLVYRSLLDFSL